MQTLACTHARFEFPTHCFSATDRDRAAIAPQSPDSSVPGAAVLQGRHSSAPGKAPGPGGLLQLSPDGASFNESQSGPGGVALSGLAFDPAVFSGRRPGLSEGAPSGLTGTPPREVSRNPVPPQWSDATSTIVPPPAVAGRERAAHLTRTMAGKFGMGRRRSGAEDRAPAQGLGTPSFSRESFPC